VVEDKSASLDISDIHGNTANVNAKHFVKYARDEYVYNDVEGKGKGSPYTGY
jgi:hypothetical protein